MCSEVVGGKLRTSVPSVFADDGVSTIASFPEDG